MKDSSSQPASRPFGSKDSHFTATRWTLVRSAVQSDDAAGMKALNDLCSRYYYPLYAFARNMGLSEPDAQDVLQDMFVNIRSTLRSADASQGKLRSFLLGALQHVKINHYQKGQAAKRGGGCEHVSIEATALESRFGGDLESTSASPEEMFEYRWAVEIFLDALVSVGLEWHKRGRGRQFMGISPFVLRPLIELAPDLTREMACKALDVTNDNLKYMIKEARSRFKVLLPETIKETLTEPGLGEIASGGEPTARMISEEVTHLYSLIESRRLEDDNGAKFEWFKQKLEQQLPVLDG